MMKPLPQTHATTSPSGTEADSFDWELFFRFLEKKAIVPIVGDELVRVKYAGRSYSFLEYLTLKLREQTHRLDGPTSFFDFMGQKRGDRVNSSWLKIIYRDITRDMLDLEPLVKLARVTDLDLFCSTTLDNFLCQSLARVRSKPGLANWVDCQNISFSSSARGSRLPSDRVGKVFNLFGSLDAKDKFASDESELLDFTVELLRDSPHAEALRGELDGKHLLVLGVHLPFYHQALLLRALAPGRLQSHEQLRFFALSNGADELARVLGEDHPQRFRSDRPDVAVAFVEEMYERWLLRNSQKTKRKYRGYVHLSFAQADSQAASQLRFLLEQNGVEVVLTDHQAALSLAEDALKRRLDQRVKDCAIFLPLVSEKALDEGPAGLFRQELVVAHSRAIFSLAEDQATDFIIPKFLGKLMPTDPRVPDFLTFRDAKILEDFQIIELVTRKLVLLD